MRDNRFVRTELIGLDVEVLSEPFSGIAGEGRTIDIKGSEIMHRPEDRIKKVR